MLYEAITENINDFADVSVDEKTLMKLWNGHLLAHPVLADSQIAGCSSTNKYCTSEMECATFKLIAAFDICAV